MGTFQSIIDKLAYRSGVFSEIKVRMILNSWEDILGSTLSSKTKPLAIRNGILFVLCEDGVWASELKYYTNEILKALNEKLENIRDVKTIKIVRRSEEVVDKL